MQRGPFIPIRLRQENRTDIKVLRLRGWLFDEYDDKKCIGAQEAAEDRSAMKTFNAAGWLTKVDILLASDIGRENDLNSGISLSPAIRTPTLPMKGFLAVSSRTCWMRWSKNVMPTMPLTFSFSAAVWYVNIPPALRP
jgi:hypothetical protein